MSLHKKPIVMEEEYGTRVNSTLSCPVCENAYMHHGRVRTYSRDAEDSAEGVVTDSLDGGEESVSAFNAEHDITSMQHNPSLRRNGIRIEVECEYCHWGNYDAFGTKLSPMHLCISQHKGATLMWWEWKDDVATEVSA